VTTAPREAPATPRINSESALERMLIRVPDEFRSAVASDCPAEQLTGSLELPETHTVVVEVTVFVTGAPREVTVSGCVTVVVFCGKVRVVVLCGRVAATVVVTGGGVFVKVIVWVSVVVVGTETVSVSVAL